MPTYELPANDVRRANQDLVRAYDRLLRVPSFTEDELPLSLLENTDVMRYVIVMKAQTIETGEVVNLYPKFQFLVGPDGTGMHINPAVSAINMQLEGLSNALGWWITGNVYVQAHDLDKNEPLLDDGRPVVSAYAPVRLLSSGPEYATQRLQNLLDYAWTD